MLLTPHISLLVRTAAVLKGSAASASPLAAAAILPFALPVAIRRAIVAAGAVVVGHACDWTFLGSLLHSVRRANMWWGEK
jgi:hypothetical protein